MIIINDYKFITLESGLLRKKFFCGHTWLFLLQYYENLGPRISKFSIENFPFQISSLKYENGVKILRSGFF